MMNSADACSTLDRFAHWVIRARLLIIGGSLVLLGAAASGIIFLESSTDYRQFFDDDNPELLKFELLENTYEKSDNVLFMVIPNDHDAISQEAIAATIWLTEQAWQIPFVSRVDSLANFQVISAQGDELEVRDLIHPDQISSLDEHLKIRAEALADPRIAGNILAHDGGISAIYATIKLPENDSATHTAAVAEFAYQLAIEGKERFPSIDFRVLGIVIINQLFNDETLAAFRTVVPASLVIMALILGILTRGFAVLAVTGSVVILAIFATMGLAGWFGILFSTSTSVTPVILLTIAVANCMHIIAATQRKIGSGIAKVDAVTQSVAANLRSIVLASATTAFGFMMMNFSEVPPYRDLGTLVATGTVIAFVLSITFYPALLSLIPIKARVANKTRFSLAALAESVIRHRKLVLWSSGLIVIGLAAAIPRNEINDVVTEYFDEDSQLRQDAEFLDKNLSGNTQIEYSISAGESGKVTDPSFLHDVDAFVEWYRSQPETRHVFAISDTFKQLNKAMQNDDLAAYHIPEDPSLAAQFLLLYELSLPFGFDLNNRIDVSKSATRMTVTTRTLSTSELLELDARAKSWLRENSLSFSEVQSSGPALMFAHLGQRNIRAMLLGTVVAFLGVSCILLAAFRSVRIGAMSLVSNFVPGIMAFGIWGLTTAHIGLTLAVVMAMTIGIVVDDTVHFLTKYLHARRERGLSPEDAIRHAFVTVGPALTATTAVLVAGFLVLGFSSFLPTAHMGQLTAIVIALALVCDFLLLPPLLLTVDRKIKL